MALRSARASISQATQQAPPDVSDRPRQPEEPRKAPVTSANSSFLEQARAFSEKFSNDWGMNLAGLLAYNFLGAFFPLLLGLLALAALVLPADVVHNIGDSLNASLPQAASGLNVDFNVVLEHFEGKAATVTTILSFAVLLWTGSSLFGVMENCFGIIFRTQGRSFLRQKLMSLLMIFIFAVLTPLSLVGSTLSGLSQIVAKVAGDAPGLALLIAAGSYATGVVFAFLLFFSLYFVVPNMGLSVGNTWRGALAAAVLFEAVGLVFPWYSSHFGGGNQFGTVAGLLAILTIWFWVISLLVLLGAEVNSYFAMGQRAMAGDLPALLHLMNTPKDPAPENP